MPVYLDHAASAPIHPAAAAAVRDWLEHGYGNPSGSHAVARRAKAVVEDAREVVARFLGVEPGGVVFTSGGTEADNLGVLGPLTGGPIVVSAIEHPAVLESARWAGTAGREIRIAGVGPDGLVDLEGLRSLVDREVGVVSIQTANHEIGVVQPIPAIARRIRRWSPGALFHTDAVQAAAWLDLPEATEGADLLSISAHKLGGPQGIGALGVRSDVALAPVIRGGGQERERRSGTLNVAAIAGMAAAIEALVPTRAEQSSGVARRRDLLAGLISEAVPGAVLTAQDSPKVPGHCHFRFPGVENEELLFLLDQRGVCASAGAACASGAIEASPVLLAIGVEKSEALSALRLTLGPTTTDEDVRVAAAVVAEAVTELRSRQ